LVVTSVSLAQPLWTFGKLSTLKDMAHQGIEVSRATVRVAEDELRYQMARAWWGLVLVHDLREMIEEGQKLMAEQQEKLEKQKDEGDDDYNPSDLLKLKVSAAELEDKARQFHRNKALAEDALRVAMGDRHDLPVAPQGELQPLALTPLPMEAYEALALANSPRLLAMRGGVRVEVLQAEMAANNLWPDILFIARYASVYAPSREATQDSLATNPNNSATSGVGITVRWNIDLFRNVAKLNQARAEATQATLAERGERERIRAEVRNLVREMLDYRAMIDVQDKAYRAARGWLSSEQQNHEDGLGEFAEVLRALESYYRRRLAYAEAIYNFNVAVAAVSRAVGQDITTIVARTTPAKP
jgi:outer membrane protein TolC